MGQEYSHVCMEVALTTKPNFAILLEEVEERSMSLLDIVRSVADVVEARAAAGKNYGTVLIPDGLIDAIPELKFLISELDSICAASAAADSQPLGVASVKGSLTHWSRTILERLPEFMQVALLLGRGSDGKINVSQIETEKLLAHFVEIELGYRKKRGTYKGSFSAVCSFVGYQARGALPTNFDVAYAANLGHAAVALLASGKCTGYVATVRNLKEPVKDWLPGGVPLCTLLESSTPGAEAQIPRAKVDLSSPAFKAYAEIVSTSGVTDRYENPGPVQFEGPSELTDACTNSLRLSNTNYLADVSALQETLAKIGAACRPGCDPKLISSTLANLEAVTHVLHQDR
jgi:diphosphate--fructose-6-phosphate 1-phosphotransferase